MGLVSILLGVVLFVAFVPGVLVTLPKHGKYSTVLLVHGVLFAVVTHYVMKFYFSERFGNYGAAGCPPCFVMNADGVCKPDPGCSGPNSALPGIKMVTK